MWIWKEEPEVLQPSIWEAVPVLYLSVGCSWVSIILLNLVEDYHSGIGFQGCIVWGCLPLDSTTLFLLAWKRLIQQNHSRSPTSCTLVGLLFFWCTQHVFSLCAFCIERERELSNDPLNQWKDLDASKCYHKRFFCPSFPASSLPPPV